MTDSTPNPSPSRDLDDEALAWFARAGRGPAAGQDADLQAWLAADPARQLAFARWQADWQRLDGLPAGAVEQLRRQLAADKARQVGPPASASRRGWLRGLSALVPQAAVALAVVSVTGGGWLAWDHWQTRPVFTRDFVTERGQQLDVQLPDGSRLRLDTATRVAVTLYRQRREVKLAEGQVVFQVQGDPSRPFDVLAGSMRVTVVGTRFSVRHTASIPGDDGVRVAVEEGRVRVGHVDARAPIELRAGQQVSADARGALTSPVAVGASGIAPWRDGRITFDNIPLAQVLAEFERYGQTGLVLRDPAVGNLRLTGTFDPQRLGNFLLALPKVLPVRLRTHADTTEIVAAR